MMRTAICIALLFLSSLLVAQSNRFNFGFELSGVASQVSGDGSAGFNRPGIGGGVISEIRLPSDRIFKFGLTYIQKGSRVWADASKGIESYQLNAHYIEVPLIWEWNISNLTFETGLTASRNIKTEELDHFRNSNSFPNREPFFAELGFLIGYSHALTESIDINLRYGNSITPFRPHASGQTFLINFGQYHSYCQIGMNYYFK